MRASTTAMPWAPVAPMTRMSFLEGVDMFAMILKIAHAS